MEATKTKQPIRPLDYPDLLYLQAAEGWFDLSNLKESNAELDQITPAGRVHRDVMHLRWRISAATQQWESCLVLSRALTAGFPGDPQSWLTLAETFYQMGDVQKAYRIASSNVADFPDSPQLLYDAACYACLLGRFEEAQFFFERALGVGDKQSIRRRALADPDLKALWTRLSASPRGKAMT